MHMVLIDHESMRVPHFIVMVRVAMRLGTFTAAMHMLMMRAMCVQVAVINGIVFMKQLDSVFLRPN